MSAKKRGTRYQDLILEIFRRCKNAGDMTFPRVWIEEVALEKGIALPKNQGDLIYNLRFRAEMPEEVADSAPMGQEWVIELAGRSIYRFALVKQARLIPRTDLVAIKIPDSTPEIVADYALGDEQALLAVVRYNRLIDIFLGITAYSLQNHLRTSVRFGESRAQIEIDELYVGLNAKGEQFVIPVQAKGGSDKLSPVQSSQDIAWCRERFPDVSHRSVSAQFMGNKRIGMMELTLQDGEIRVVQERLYQLVPASEIDRKRGL